MSVGRCLTRALEITELPRSEWQAAVEALPDSCAHTDVCGQPHSCRKRISAFLRVQWQIAARKEALALSKRGGNEQ